MHSRPNIVWLVADHYALMQFEHYASVHGLRRPAWERLARTGTRFDAAYAVCPLCTPARASMVTGLYPHRHGMTANDGQCGSLMEFPSEIELFNAPLRRAGYRTGYFGKWHCGNKRLPRDYGFEGWSLPSYGFPYHAPEYRAYLAEAGLPAPEVDVEWSSGRGAAGLGRIRVQDEPNAGHRMETSGVLRSPKETHEAYFVTHLANRWIESCAAAGDRFCARVDVWGPHHPYWVAAPFAGMVDPSALAPYPGADRRLDDRPRHQQECLEEFRQRMGMDSWRRWQPVLARCLEHVSLVDHALATVLDTLDRLEVADDTLIVMTADHGDIVASNGGMFDKAWFMVEETMRIPLAMRWPRVVAAGGASRALVTNMDVVPTVLAAAGCAVEGLDGRSLLPLVGAPGSAVWPDDVMCQHHGHYQRTVFQRMLRCGDLKYVAHLDDTDELYDVSTDPRELRNRVDDTASADDLRAMRRRLVVAMDRARDSAEPAARLRARLVGQATGDTALGLRALSDQRKR